MNTLDKIASNLCPLLREFRLACRIGRQSYMHAATIIDPQNNSYRFLGLNDDDTHAEINSLKKFMKIGFKRKKRNRFKMPYIDLVVIRVNNSGLFCMSKPCLHCIIELNKKCGDNLRYVYYSTDTRNIVREKFSSLVNDKNKHMCNKRVDQINGEYIG